MKAFEKILPILALLALIIIVAIFKNFPILTEEESGKVRAGWEALHTASTLAILVMEDENKKEWYLKRMFPERDLNGIEKEGKIQALLIQKKYYKEYPYLTSMEEEIRKGSALLGEYRYTLREGEEEWCAFMKKWDRNAISPICGIHFDPR